MSVIVLMCCRARRKDLNIWPVQKDWKFVQVMQLYAFNTQLQK